MHLNATLTAERGKSINKTANEFIEVELTAFREVVGHITIDIQDEGTQYIIKWFPRGIDGESEDYHDPVILKEGHITEGTIQELR